MHLFLSPHLDDAILSCGGWMHALIERGERVQMLTLMAGDPPDPLPDSPLIRELHDRWASGSSPVETRRAEDRAAAAMIGCDASYADLPDCIYRTADGLPLYPTGAALFAAIHPHDPALPILAAYPLPDHTDLYLPLTIGQHVDHQLTRNAFQNRGKRLYFYEDYPYAEHGAGDLPNRHTPPLRAITHQLSADHLEAKLNAVACYRSQISTFWRDDDDMRRRISQFMRSTGGGNFAERYWYTHR